MIPVFTDLLVLFVAYHEETEASAADSTDDMAELRNVIGMETVQNLSADEDDADDDKCDWNLAALYIRNGREDDQHEHDTARAEQGGVRAEERMEYRGYYGSDTHHLKQIAAAVLFLHKRTEKKDVGHVAGEVLPVGMTDCISERANIGHRVQKTGPVCAEQMAVRPAVRYIVKKKRDSADHDKGKRDRSIEFEMGKKTFHGVPP